MEFIEKLEAAGSISLSKFNILTWCKMYQVVTTKTVNEGR